MNTGADKTYDSANVLELIRGKEHELLDEQNILDPQKIMYPAFRAALFALQGVLESSDAWNMKHSVIERIDSVDLYGYANNVLAFCAARGQGKTSAMLSFSRALNWYHCEKTYKESKSEELTQILGSRRFVVLPPIDPTMLGTGDSVVELILSKLLSKISHLWDSPDQRNTVDRGSFRISENQKHEVLKRIQSCYEGLSKGAKKEYSASERLLQTGDVFDIKANLLYIVRELLRLHGGESQKDILVIQLDDTDMQLENAYDILEEVRKYLSIPNTVVLFATYLSQLRALVSTHYRKVLKENAEAFEYDYMAAKYIDKLIPSSQAIHLPSVKLQQESGNPLRLAIKDENTPKDDADYPRMEEALFNLIQQKTGLVFIRHSSPSHIHDMIPSTLRGVAHLYRLLDQMPSPNEEIPHVDEIEKFSEAEISKLNIRLNNLALFENYFIHDWCASRLDKDSLAFIKCLEYAASPRRIQLTHSHVRSIMKPTRLPIQRVQLLNESFGETKSNNDDSTDKLTSDNINYFSLLKELLEWEHYCNTDSEFRFRFALCTYFSIQLNRGVISGLIGRLNERFQVPRVADTRKDAPDEIVTVLTEKLAANNRVDESVKIENAWVDRLSNMEKVKAVYGQQVNIGTIGEERFENEIQVLEALVYFFCNWDVLHQFFNNSNPITYAGKNSVGNKLEAFKEALKIRKAPLFEDTDRIERLVEVLTVLLSDAEGEDLHQTDDGSGKGVEIIPNQNHALLLLSIRETLTKSGLLGEGSPHFGQNQDLNSEMTQIQFDLKTYASDFYECHKDIIQCLGEKDIEHVKSAAQELNELIMKEITKPNEEKHDETSD